MSQGQPRQPCTGSQALQHDVEVHAGRQAAQTEIIQLFQPAQMLEPLGRHRWTVCEHTHTYIQTHTHTDRWVLKFVASAPSRTSVHTWCSVVSALDCGQCPPHSGGRRPAARGGQRSPPGSGGACCGTAYPPGLCQPLATRHTITTGDITTAYEVAKHGRLYSKLPHNYNTQTFMVTNDQ